MNYTESEENKKEIKKEKLYGVVAEIYRDDQRDTRFAKKLHPFLRILNTFKEGAGYPMGPFVYPLSFVVDLTDSEGIPLNRRIECFMYLKDLKGLKLTPENTVEMTGAYTDADESHFNVATLLNVETQKQFKNQLCIPSKLYKCLIFPISIVSLIGILLSDILPSFIPQISMPFLLIAMVIHYPLAFLWLPLVCLFIFIEAASTTTRK